MLTLGKLLKNINFNYRRSEEPIRTLLQANKDFINLKQQKMNPTAYFEKFKAIKKVVEELNQSVNGHASVEILCWEQPIGADGLDVAEKTKLIADGKKRIIGMRLIMDVNHNTYGTLIKDYDREYLGRISKYPKILQDA